MNGNIKTLNDNLMNEDFDSAPEVGGKTYKEISNKLSTPTRDLIRKRKRKALKTIRQNKYN